MKRCAAILVVCLILAALLTGCAKVSYGGQGESLGVWSFRGENDEIAVSNGVIVISPDTETLYGGNLTVKTEAFDEVAAYTVRIELDTDDGRMPHGRINSINVQPPAQDILCGRFCARIHLPRGSAAEQGSPALSL